MRNRIGASLLSWGLGAVTVLVLLAHMPHRSSVDSVAWMVFTGLVAFMLNLGTMLNEGAASPASTAVLMVYLTLGGEQSSGTALWSVATGSLIGYVVWLLRTPPSRHLRREYPRVIKSIVVGTAQLTLSVFVSGWVYGRLNGRLPLNHLDSSDTPLLAAYVFAFLAAYLGILFLEAYLVRQLTPYAVIHQWQGVVQMLLLPLPFAIVGAVTYHQVSSLAFGILILGLLIIVTGINLMNRAQARARRQVRELQSISAISHMMRSNQNLSALLDVVAEQVTHLLAVDSFAIALYDASRNVVYFPLNVQRHQPDPLEPREVGRGLIDHVIRTGQSLLIEDQVARQAEEMGLEPPEQPVYSWMGAPLQAADRILGCMAVFSSQPGRFFSAKDLQLLMTVAAQAGVAVDNAQLYQQARDRSIQLATLNNVAAILNGTLDMQQVLDLTASSAVAVAGCQAIALYLRGNGSPYSLTLARQTGLSSVYVDAPMRPLALNSTDLQRRRQPVLVTDVLTDQRTASVRVLAAHEAKRSWSEFLLRKGDELLGILIFFYNEPRHFEGEEIELLRNFTNQAAQAISNARLYTQTDAALNRRVEQLSALADTNRELASMLNLTELFQLVLDRALEATQSRNGILLLRTEEDDLPPGLAAYRGFPPQVFEQVNPLIGWVAKTYRTGQPTLIADVRQESEIFPLDDRTRAQLNVPVMRGTEVLGVISLGSDRPNDYGPDDLSFVTQLATQARIAIDNARLFRRIEIARDRLQVILDTMKEGVVLISAEGFVTLANPRVHLLLGLEPEWIVDRPVVDLMDDPALCLAERLGFGADTLLSLVRHLREKSWDGSTRDGGRTTFVVPLAQKDRYLDRSMTPVRDESGAIIGLLLVFSDVTEARELAQARQDLSSMIVHDLRGPLTAISTSLKLLHEIAPQDDPLGRAVRQTTETSARAMRKLLNLVDSILDVSKLESGMMTLERVPTSLHATGALVLEEMLPVAQELEVKLGLDVPDDLPLIMMDAEKIERVLLNLVDNAIKFTPSGGRVTVRARGMSDIEGAVRVEVADTGPGIPDEYKERLFEPFAQIDGQHGRRRGTGLGLTFCKLAIEAHEGAIWIEDSPQGGSVFVFTLPVTASEPSEFAG